jgi:two-component system phosphate regulon sensor histidine kinase PhoR
MSSIQTKTPALFASAIIVAINIVILLYFYISQHSPIHWQSVLLLTMSLGVIVFFINYFLIDKFFYSNIKHIYKNILQLRNADIKTSNLKIKDNELMPEINRMLINWEKEQKEEISHLKELETYRREFLGNVSHELKTPIFSVQGYIHTLLDGGIEDHDINLLYLQKASKSLDRLTSIVEDLEAISKLEAGEMIIEPRTFDIIDLCSEVIESLEFKARQKNIRLINSEGTTKQIYVNADKERIRQVLVNLLDNSIKYGKENGETRIDFFNDVNIVSIDVSDNGIGIEKQHLQRLFERFYRVDKSRSREAGGTGLGLAIVKHIIEAHQQRIAVTSENDKGTTFSFTLKKS